MFYNVFSLDKDTEKAKEIVSIAEKVHINSACVGDYTVREADVDDRGIFCTEDTDKDSFEEALENVICITAIAEDEFDEYSIEALIIDADEDELTVKCAIVLCTNETKVIKELYEECDSKDELVEKASSALDECNEAPEQDLEEYCVNNDIEWIDDADVSDLPEDMDEENEVKVAEGSISAGGLNDKVRLNIFTDGPVLAAIKNMEINSEPADCAIAVDLISVPFHMVYSTENGIHFRLASRNEMGASPDADFSIDIAEGSTEPEFHIGSEGMEQSSETFVTLYRFSEALSKYINANGIQEQYPEMDIENEGLLITLVNDEIKIRLVEGRKRPNMACMALFGGTTMGRPYMNEFALNSLLDMASPDELEEAAQNGDIDAMNRLSALYTNGDDATEPDAEKAVCYAQMAADAEDSTGMYNLGVFYGKGFGVEKNMEKAAYWLEKAAEYGDPDGLPAAELFRKGAELKKKAESGDVQAMGEYAEHLMTIGSSLPGYGYFEDSVCWAEKGIESGCAFAYWILALAYEHGRGVEEDVKKAVKYYQAGADMGDAHCQHSIGSYYLNGAAGVKKDRNKAAELCKKAAEQGYELSMFTLAKAYENGYFGEYDYGKMLEWGEKAAEAGSAEIQYEVAKMYMNEDENGNMLDKERARYWLKEAADNGYEKAMAMLAFSPDWNDNDEASDDNERVIPTSFSLNEDELDMLFGSYEIDD